MAPAHGPPARSRGRVITVVTPTLPERGAMLAEAVQSVHNQTLQPAVHLIAVDLHRAGPGPLLNQLTAAARTEWVSILADDDLYDHDHLETLAKVADGADVVFSWGRITGSPERHSSQYRGEFSYEEFLRRHDSGLRGCFMFRKGMWAKVGGWHDEQAEDWNFLRRMILDGAHFKAVYKETWTYRFHDSNASYDYQRLDETGERRGHLARFK